MQIQTNIHRLSILTIKLLRGIGKRPRPRLIKHRRFPSVSNLLPTYRSHVNNSKFFMNKIIPIIPAVTIARFLSQVDQGYRPRITKPYIHGNNKKQTVTTTVTNKEINTEI